MDCGESHSPVSMDEGTHLRGGSRQWGLLRPNSLKLPSGGCLEHHPQRMALRPKLFK